MLFCPLVVVDAIRQCGAETKGLYHLPGTPPCMYIRHAVRIGGSSVDISVTYLQQVLRCEDLTRLTLQIVMIRDVTPCGRLASYLLEEPAFSVCPEDGGSLFLRNVSNIFFFFLLLLLVLFLLLLLLRLFRLLIALPSLVNLDLFQNCPPLFSVLLLTSPVRHAHILQIFLDRFKAPKITFSYISSAF